MEGISPLLHHVSHVFRSQELEKRHRLGPALMYWLVNAEIPSVLSPLDGDGRWTFGCAAGLAQGDPVELIRQALGFDADIDILTRDEWTAHQLIATKYRVGPVFLAGDACHLHPPFGGFGMNMGIGDALDLGWKLAATLSGWGGAGLLDSYEIERLQVHLRVIAEAVANHAILSGQLAVEHIEDAGPKADNVRSDVGARIIASKRREFDSLGIVLGSRYRDSNVMTPGASEQGDDDASDYRPSASAGCLAPHAWLQEGTARGASLYDHFSNSGLTLLVTRQALAPVAAAVAAAAAEQAKGRSYPVVEQDQMLWMGDAALADPALIVRHPWHDDPAWVWIKDRYPINANYQLITDKLMDLTHVGYVHGRTIGGTPQAHCDADTQTTRSQTSVNVTRWMMNSVPPPAYVAGHKFNTPTVDRWMEIDFFPPAAVRIHTGATDAGTGAREGNRQGGFAFMGLNLQTPETEKTTHYFWSGARSRRAGEPAVRDALLASLSITFAEDKVVVEAQQASLDRDPAVPLVMIASDAGLVHARRLVAAMIDTEAKTSNDAGGSHEAPLRERQTEEAQHEA